jgi:hypothetical protein
MCDTTAQLLIETSLRNGYKGNFGELPLSYFIYVTDNTVVFSKFIEDDEELIHLCLNCVLLDCNFIQFLLNEEPAPHLRELVCLTLEEKIKYLENQLENKTIKVSHKNVNL